MVDKNSSSNTLDSLMNMLGSKDGMARKSARESLVAMGAPAVPSLMEALQDSPSDKVRWEAAKSLGFMGDKRAIPTLVKALRDDDDDVVWLAAEGLKTFGRAAWPELLGALEGIESVALRKGAHHVFLNQQESGYDDLLVPLMSALELVARPESASLLAQKLLARMSENTWSAG